MVSLIVTAATFSVQPHVKDRLLGAPAGFVFPALAVAGLVVVYLRLRAQRRPRRALRLGRLPRGHAHERGLRLLPLSPAEHPGAASRGLTVHDSAAADSTLALSLWWWIPALAITIAYQVWIYRHFAGKVRPGEGHYG